jgi:hypothetical protein
MRQLGCGLVVQRWKKLLHALAVHPKASANSSENTTAPAPCKINLAVAGHLYYHFTRKKLSTEKLVRSPKLST